MSYYNTTGLASRALRHAFKKTIGQEAIVKDIFLKHPRVGYTPFQILDRWPKELKKPPITSIRRAVNNLTARGILEKTEEKRVERQGAPNYKWRLTSRKKYEINSSGQMQLNL